MIIQVRCKSEGSYFRISFHNAHRGDQRRWENLRQVICTSPTPVSSFVDRKQGCRRMWKSWTAKFSQGLAWMFWPARPRSQGRRLKPQTVRELAQQGPCGGQGAASVRFGGVPGAWERQALQEAQYCKFCGSGKRLNPAPVTQQLCCAACRAQFRKFCALGSRLDTV